MATSEARSFGSGASLLHVLERAAHRWVSAEMLQKQCQMDHDRLYAEAGRVRQYGLHIEQDRARGLRLAPHCGPLVARAIEYELGTRRVGRNVVVLQETASTNDVAWQVAEQSDCDGAVIFAESQTAGRGRLGAPWFGGDLQSLLLSVVVVASGDDMYFRQLNLAAAVAVVDSISGGGDLQPTIRWPNDVLVDDKKVCGAMIEARVVGGRSVGVLGVGINCLQRRCDFPPELRATAASLQMLGQEAVDRTLLARRLLRQLDQWLTVVERGDQRLLREAWRLHAADLPRRLLVARDGQFFRGRTIVADPLDGLTLDLDSGQRRTFDPGTTRIVR